MSLPIDVQTHEACKAAVLHVLKSLRDDPRKFWLMGDGTESFEKLTAAAALVYGEPQEKVKGAFRPRKAEYDLYVQDHQERERLLRYCEYKGIKAEAE